MKRVLVLDANQRSALATTRSLGRHGVPVLTADESDSALAGCSRFSQHYLVYPSPRDDPAGFIAQIVRLVDQHRIDIVLPMTELTTQLLLDAQHRFSGTVFPFPELSTIEVLSNKSTLMRLAQTRGVPIPESWFVENSKEIPENLSALPYPLIIKPSKSWVLVNGHWQRVGVQIADTPETAQQLINTNPALQKYPFLLQRCVSGTGQGIFALYDHGTPIAFFSHRRLREKPPWGGVSVLSESTPLDPILLTHARALLDAVTWHGIAMVEFKVADDGTPYLMEINTRFWGSLQLATDAGVDFPWLLYNLACGTPIAPVSGYKTGCRLRWILGDLDSLYLTLQDNRIPLQAKMVAVGRFLLPSPFRTRHETNRWADLGPFWWELRDYVHHLLGRG